MKYKIKKGLIFEKKGNKITIFDSETSSMFNFNETASLILNEIKKNKDKSEIANLLKKDYKITGVNLLKDVNNLIRQLRKATLVTMID